MHVQFSQSVEGSCETCEPGEPYSLNVSLPSGQTFSLNGIIQDGVVFVEGDIVIETSQTDLGPEAIISTEVGRRWLNGAIPYYVNSALPDLERIHAAAKHITDRTNLVVRPYASGDKNYVEVMPSTKCNSMVGMRGGRQEINLSSACVFGNVVHEFLHAAGLWHEQSREDRDEFVTILLENVSEGEQRNFDKHVTDADDFGHYDYESIMHYPPFAFSKNDQRTIIPKATKGPVRIGQREGMSLGDIAAINVMYP